MKVLFIGNSYTFFNDMPNLLERLAKDNGKELHCDSVTKGGRHLYQNLTDGDENGEKIKMLSSETVYDALFLQEQSFFPIVNYDQFLYGVQSLKNIVHAKRTVLYSTWGRKEGSSKLDELSLTSEEMTEKLTNAYISVAKETNSEISKVGKAFLSISKAFSEIDLYNKDLSHPSYIGSVVAAICHYGILFCEMPQNITSLKNEEFPAEKIIKIIEETINEN